MSEVIKIKAEEITILPAEVEAKVEEEISLALVEANATEEMIAKMEMEFMPLTIKDNNDKEGYLIVSETRKQVKKARVFAGKVFKKGREEAKLIVNKWLVKEKGVIGRLEKIETHLELQEEAYEKAENDRKAAEKARKEQQGAERMRDMISFGAKMEGLYWVLNGVSYEVALVKEVDPEVYGDIRAEFEAEFNKAEAVRLEKEKKDQEDREALAAQQQQVQAQLAEAKKMRMEGRISFLLSLGMKKGDSSMADRVAYVYQGVSVLMSQIESADGADWEVIATQVTDDVAKTKAEIAEIERLREIFRTRILRLKGWSSNGQSVYAKGDTWGTTLDLVEKSEEDFEEMVKENDAYIRAKEEAKREGARLEGVGAGRREMLKAISGDAGISDLELGQIDEAQWKQDYQVAKSLYDKNQKDVADQKEKERQELLGEKQKYEELVASIKAIHVPVFKSGQYRGKTNIIRDFIDGLK